MLKQLKTKNFWSSLVLPLVMVVAGLAYFFGVDGPFLFDDYYNLELLGARGGVTDIPSAIQFIFGVEQFEINRPLAQLSFLIDDQHWPTQPDTFKRTNIFLHLLTGALIGLFLLGALSARLPVSQARFIAIMAACIWLVHPLHVSTTLYVVQRMTILATLFAVASLLFYVQFRHYRWGWKKLLHLILAGLCAILAFLSKENAAVVLLLYVLVDRLLLAKSDPPDRVERILMGAFVVCFLSAYGYAVWSTAGGFEHRAFSMIERMLSQGYVLYKYLVYYVLPGSAGMGLYHDDVGYLLQDDGHLWMGLFWLLHGVIIALCIWLRRAVPIIAFGVLFYYASHVIESTLIPLELMFEHRNYLGSIGLSVAVGAGLWQLYRALLVKGVSSLVVQSLVALPVIILLVFLAHRSAIWSDYRILAPKWAAEHPYSLRAQTAFLDMLRVQGMEKVALDTIDVVHARFDDLSMMLLRAELECTVSPEREDVKIDLRQVPSMTFRINLLFYLQRAIESPHKKCIDARVIGGRVEDLVFRAEEMGSLTRRPRFYAKYLDFAADVAALQGDYGKTVKYREKLWEIQPSPYTALRLSSLFLSGGNVDQAEYYYLRAEELFLSYWFYDDKRLVELNQFKKAIRDKDEEL